MQPYSSPLRTERILHEMLSGPLPRQTWLGGEVIVSCEEILSRRFLVLALRGLLKIARSPRNTAITSEYNLK